MWKSCQCSNCQNETWCKVEEVNILCEKCEELVELRQENKKLKQELIHYLGELKMLYTRPDSKRFCENKINELKNS